jgi:hypothetical protein
VRHKEVSSRVFNLDPKLKRVVWDFWFKNGWVEGPYDGCISWRGELDNVPVMDLQDLFFGISVDLTRCRTLTELGYIPLHLVPHLFDVKPVEPDDHPEVYAKFAITPVSSPTIPKTAQTKLSPPKVKSPARKSKRSMRGGAKKGKNCFYIKATKFGNKIEIGRATRDDFGKWIAVAYEGVSQTNQMELNTQREAFEWLSNLPGVGRVKKIYR